MSENLTVAIPPPVEMATEELERLLEVAQRELQERNQHVSSSLRPQHFRRMLDHLGERPQAKGAARARGIEDVSRKMVLQFLGRDEGRRLSGPPKSIVRAMAELASSDTGFPTTPKNLPLEVDYASGMSAAGFFLRPADHRSLRLALGLEA
ncbi:hypothetical protein [Amycolatopsis tucumanensis]|uniref:Uncharacterized protein n=1 Tax=Amycolatopsis tucumanensis TaxID=401106 RepID=A0ABP7HD87_9PSEU|nr:hypothetical protein [Amycolatopsis tucumanensis]MCF6423687.1 hypothetical protein [Amycolatopsis tucumanensis]